MPPHEFLASSKFHNNCSTSIIKERASDPQWHIEISVCTLDQSMYVVHVVGYNEVGA